MSRSAVLLVALAFLQVTLAFAPLAPHKTAPSSPSALRVMQQAPPAQIEKVVVLPSAPSFEQPSQLMTNVGERVVGSSQLLSLQERRPPTAEEIAAKKRNFNLWFWGGGFVAPFLATFYYFG